jgi:uncharacterized SAM-binding protein YcdF (DUF218 family)
MFLFKKIVASFFLPIPLIILVSFLGLSLIIFTKRQRAGKIMISVGLCTLFLLSCDPISSIFLKSLEHQYSPYRSMLSVEDAVIEQQYPVKYVVVLAGGIISDPTIPVTSQLTDTTLIRLIEGLRIYRENPGSRLILSGGSGSMFYYESNAMADVAKAVGIDENDIITETDSRDTKDQAHFIKLIVNNDPFVLVTSASHMPRSMAMFKKLGMEPIPAPAGCMVGRKKLSLRSFFPSATALRKSELAFHEYLGILWAKLRGQI